MGWKKKILNRPEDKDYNFYELSDGKGATFYHRQEKTLKEKLVYRLKNNMESYLKNILWR